MNRFLTRPLYLQLRDALVERIATGQWKPGSMVPNEGDLAREFGVSPGTMRKALDLMESMRLLTRRQGRGTVVNDPSSEELASRYTNLRRADGRVIADDVKSGEITESPANETERIRLRLAKDDRVFRAHRRRLHEARAYMVEEASMPTALFPGLADDQNPSPGITELAGHYGLLLGNAEERVSVGEASLEVAEALGIAFASPVLVLDRVVYGLDGRPVEWRMGWCHSADRMYLAEMR
jgi:GntR family transcriptional regulator